MDENTNVGTPPLSDDQDDQGKKEEVGEEGILPPEGEDVGAGLP